jgi:flagellar protein FlgJ
MGVAFTDIQGLSSITALGRTDRGAALDQVARQFESFFVAEILKGVRAANAVLSEDNPFNTQEMAFRQDMLDRQLSVSLTEGRGLGIAAMFARQLRQQFGDAGAHGKDPVGTLDAREIAARTVERAPTDAAGARTGLQHGDGPSREEPSAPPPVFPAVVRSALRIIRPLAEEASRAMDAVSRFVDKESFVRTLAPLAREAAQKLGVDHRVLLAQAALETGWGQSILGDSAGRSSFNLFNIKAGSFWPGASVGVTTLEYDGNVPRPQRSRFRAYASFADSFADYAQMLLSNERYHHAIAAASDPARFVRGLAEAGYATDPAYAAKILRLLGDPAIAEAP